MMPKRPLPKSPRAAEGADPLRLEVFQHLFAAASEEMGAALMRSAFSANIKERRDFSCALFDGEGNMVAQAAHLPVHLGAAPMSLSAAVHAVNLDPGDVVILNDPYSGGSHLPDISLVSGIFLDGAQRPQFYCLNRAHHADVGGAHPGSMAPVADVHAEGLRIPPMRLVESGSVREDVLELVLANMRVPSERRGDLLAQWAANRVGEQRVQAMAAEHGTATVVAQANALRHWTDALVGKLLEETPHGEWSAEDELEWPADETANVRLRLRLEIGRGGMHFDFSDSDDQGKGPINTVRAVAVSAVFYVIRCLLPSGTPTNEGVLRRVTVTTRPGSLCHATYPAPVAAGNVETSQRLVDLVLAALAQVLPERIPAASAGTMSNLTFGDAQGGYAYYETLGGGAGAGPGGAGAHALQTHMTNTRNTPVEVMENELPVRVLKTTVRRGSGGSGQFAGGDGLVRRLFFLRSTQVGWVAERQQSGPWGLAGGGRGQHGSARLRKPGGRSDRVLPGKIALTVEAGSEVEIRTPGGGGHGRG